MSFCKYKDKFGIPRKGFHKIRIPGFDIALTDTLLTIVLGLVTGIIISFILKINYISTFILCTLFLFILGICLHRLFCVNTTINKSIFGEV